MQVRENAIVSLYKSLPRQVPGHDNAIEQALGLTRLDKTEKLDVLNIGCGTGAQAIKLAQLLPHSQIAAIDEEASYLEEVNIKKQNITGGSIETVKASPDNLPVQKNAIDLIWSEAVGRGSGFLETLNYWKTFLKPGGVIVLSELSWLTNKRPKELEDFWMSEYPEMGSVALKTGQIQRSGLIPLAHVVLQEEGWTDNYFDPLMEKTPSFLNEFKSKNGTLHVVKDIFREMNMYSKYNRYYSYVYYVMSKR